MVRPEPRRSLSAKIELSRLFLSHVAASCFDFVAANFKGLEMRDVARQKKAWPQQEDLRKSRG